MHTNHISLGIARPARVVPAVRWDNPDDDDDYDDEDDDDDDDDDDDEPFSVLNSKAVWSLVQWSILV